MSSISEQTRWEEFKETGLKFLLAPAALVILYIFFGLFGRNFFSYAALVNIIDAAYYIGFISVGVTFVIITGGIDLSVGTVMMAAAIIGGTAYRSWGWSLAPALLFIIAVGIAFGAFNGIMISRLGMPPFIVTLGTMMISMGVGSMVSNVQSATFPTRAAADGWYKSIFKYIREDGLTIPTGALLLIGVVIISHIILRKTKMGRYIYAIGSNKEAARLSGVDVRWWEMMAYVVAGACAGIGGIAYAAVYTTVLPSAGQGFELYAIAGAVIGGTSLAGGVGTVFGTLIGVFIMSTLAVGLPAMDLQAHYQTFFTGIVVIGAVLLDMYRNRKAAEVKILTPADQYRQDRLAEIRELRQLLREAKAAGRSDEVRRTTDEISRKQQEMKKTFASMKAKEKAERARILAEEKASERAFQERKKSERA
ncbi:MAG: ABC transporter permease [Spirochaetaceae bacterium]|nr:MAG: ABC transporter permease [Spirochaetaceae bacterium]